MNLLIFSVCYILFYAFNYFILKNIPHKKIIYGLVLITMFTINIIFLTDTIISSITLAIGLLSLQFLIQRNNPHKN